MLATLLGRTRLCIVAGLRPAYGGRHISSSNFPKSVLGTEPWRCAYVQPCRRPADGRYGDNPNRLQHYYQFQVILKPSPQDIQQLYLDSLSTLGIELERDDVRFRRG